MESTTKTEAGLTEVEVGDSSELCHQKARELLITALAEPDPLLANLGVLNAKLARISISYVGTLDQAMEAPCGNMAEFDEMLPRIDRGVKLIALNERLTTWLHKQKAK